MGSCVGKKSKPLHFIGNFACFGGDGGIRTLDRALQPYNGLANRRLQPLGHVSTPADMPEVAQSRKRLDSVRAGTANCRGFPTFPPESSRPAGVLAAVATPELRRRGQGRESSLTREKTRERRDHKTCVTVTRACESRCSHRISFGARKIRVLAMACPSVSRKVCPRGVYISLYIRRWASTKRVGCA